MAKDQTLTAEHLRLAAKWLEMEIGQYTIHRYTSLEEILERYGERLLELARQQRT